MNLVQRIILVLILLTLAWYFGIDVAPGGDVPSKLLRNDRSLDLADLTEGPERVYRTTTPTGKPIQEEDEARIRPILEVIERLLIEKASLTASTSPCCGINATTDAGVCESEGCDGSQSTEWIDEGRRRVESLLESEYSRLMETAVFEGQDISFLDNVTFVQDVLLGMSQTISMKKFAFCAFVVASFVFFSNGSHHSLLAFLFFVILQVVLPFMPNGHKSTTSGRLDDGGGTFFGLRREVIVLVVFAQMGTLYLLHSCYPCIRRYLLVSSDGGSGDDSKMRVHNPLETAKSLFFLASLLASLYGVALLWYNAEAGERTSLFQCSLDNEPSMVEALYGTYIWIIITEVSGSLALILGDGSSPDEVLDQVPSTYIFWYFCLYYAPVDDMWIPMALHLLRASIKSFSFLLLERRSDMAVFMVLEPLTAVLELAYIVLSVVYHCEFPHVLLLHSFFLIEALITLLYNCYVGAQHLFDSLTIFQRLTLEEVDVYWPAEKGEVDAISGADVLPEIETGIIPGYWRKSSAKVRMADGLMAIERRKTFSGTSSFSAKSQGKLREVHKLYDDVEGHRLGFHGECWSRNRLCVYKSLRCDDGDAAISTYFKDVYWQYRSGKTAICYSEKLRKLSETEDRRGKEREDDNMRTGTGYNSQARDRSRDLSNVRIEFLPTCVIARTHKSKDGQTVRSFCAVEPYLPGEYKKWSGNLVPADFDSVDLSRDEVISAFMHYSHAHSLENSSPTCPHLCQESPGRLICDIQGTKVVSYRAFFKTGELFRLTDPQCHSPSGQGNLHGQGDLGKIGIDCFMKNHLCRDLCGKIYVSTADKNTVSIKDMMKERKKKEKRMMQEGDQSYSSVASRGSYADSLLALSTNLLSSADSRDVFAVVAVAVLGISVLFVDSSLSDWMSRWIH